MGILEKVITFRMKPGRKRGDQAKGRLMGWPSIFAFGTPLLAALALFALGSHYAGGLGDVGDTIFGLSREDSFVMIRKHTLFIPLTGSPFFFWILKDISKSDRAGILKIYLVYAFVVWAVCWLGFVALMFMPKF